MGGSGLSAAIQMAAQLELDFPTMEVLSLARSATSDGETELQIGGRYLLYHVLLCGEIRLSVALMDGVQCPENILQSPDTPAGWDVLDRLIRSMETYETADLSRPICVGDPLVHDPRSCWVIA
jgi:hypothetical protein